MRSRHSEIDGVVGFGNARERKPQIVLLLTTQGDRIFLHLRAIIHQAASLIYIHMFCEADSGQRVTPELHSRMGVLPTL